MLISCSELKQHTLLIYIFLMFALHLTLYPCYALTFSTYLFYQEMRFGNLCCSFRTGTVVKRHINLVRAHSSHLCKGEFCDELRTTDNYIVKCRYLKMC